MGKKALPLFFGINHVYKYGKGMSKRLSPFLNPGVRCFLEASPEDLQVARTQDIENIRPAGKTFARLIKWLDQKGVEIVPLDKERVKMLLHSFVRQFFLRGEFKNPLEFTYYLNRYLRERNWSRIIRLKAKPGDLIVMHPNHLQTFAVRERIPKSRVRFIDPVKRSPLLTQLPEPLTAKTLREFDERIAERVKKAQRIERRRPKPKRQPRKRTPRK